MKTNVTTDIEQAIKSFASAYGKMLEDFVEQSREIGQLLIDLIKDYPNFKEKLADEHPGISLRTLNTLERIGRGMELPELAYGAPSAGRAALRRCPISDQERILSSGVTLLLLREGKVEMLQVEIDNLTPNQVRQVFEKDTIRTIGAQRAWLEDQSAKHPLVHIERPYVIKGNIVHFTAGAQMTFSALAQILAQRRD